MGKVCELKIEDIKTLATKSLLDRFGENLEAVVLFGSIARKGAAEQSEIDYIVVIHNLPKGLVRRRFIVYDALTPILREFKRDVSVIEVDAEDIGRQITPLLINIAHDGIILYDKHGKIQEFFKRIRSAVKNADLVRYETRDGKYGWKPSRELKPGEVFIVQLED